MAETVKAVTGELIRILPDGLVFMSGFFSLLTSSFPQFILFLSLLESIAVFHLIRMGTSSLDVGFAKTLSTSQSAYCKSGFQSATFSSLSFFTSSQRSSFPSAPLYMISVGAAYLFNSLRNQINELEALGPNYSARFYISIMTLATLLFFVGSYRMFFECDTAPVVLTSILLGLFVGSILVAQNATLFGPESTNLSGIPLLRNRTATGEKMYICTTQA
jgi:hypothetical protein